MVEDNTVWPQFYGSQSLAVEHEPKCIDFTAWETGQGSGYNMICECLEFEVVGDGDQCADNRTLFK